MFVGIPTYTFLWYHRFTMNDAFRRTTSGRRSGQRFDAEHGVVTEALLFLGELDPEAIGEAIDDATHYEATPVAQFGALLNAVPAPLEGYTFVDYGAGMGRVVMLASLRRFRQVIGVEVSSALCETARANLVRWRRTQAPIACKDLRIVRADASAFRLPRGDLVAYLYNPFGERTLTRVAEAIAARRNGECFVVYHTPVHRHVFENDARFKPIARLEFGAVYQVCG